MELATRADIQACFRLILGRDPNPEEVRGHFSRIGEPLDVIVTSYLNSAEFAARGLINRKRPANVILTDFGGFKIFADSNDAAVGHHVANRLYEPEVTQVFKSHLKPGMSVIDIGANIGFFSMLSRSIVGHSGKVLSVEPNTYNARMIEASRLVNSFENVRVLLTAASDQTGILTLHTEYSNGSVANIKDVDEVWNSVLVPAIVLDDIVGDGDVNFIKIDIEGNEPAAMRGLTSTIERCKPFIVSEFTAKSLADGPVAYLQFFLARGYKLGVIKRTGDYGIINCGDDVGKVMSLFSEDGTDHIDIVAIP